MSESESCRSVQGSFSGQMEYIPEHGPEQHRSVGRRRYAGYSAAPVLAGNEEVFRKEALNGSGTA